MRKKIIRKHIFLISWFFFFNFLLHLLPPSKTTANRTYWTIACYAIPWNVHSGFDDNKLFKSLEIFFAEPGDKNLKNLISTDFTREFYPFYKITPNHYLKGIILIRFWGGNAGPSKIIRKTLSFHKRFITLHMFFRRKGMQSCSIFRRSLFFSCLLNATSNPLSLICIFLWVI